MSNLTQHDIIEGTALLAALPIPTIQLNQPIQTTEGMDETLKQTLDALHLPRKEIEIFENAVHKWHLGQIRKEEFWTALERVKDGFLLILVAKIMGTYQHKLYPKLVALAQGTANI